VVSERGVYRVLDANNNRLREGLRVVEDYYRLVCDDGRALLVKDLRHRLRALFDEGLSQACLEQRRAADDIGARTFTRSEADRGDWPVLLQANLKRAQEAARVIEECAKLLGRPELAIESKALRFALYELEQDVLDGRSAKIREWFYPPTKDSAALYLVVDEAFYLGDDFFSDLEAMLEVGIDFLQLRRKSGSDRGFLQRALALAALCRKYKTPFIVNDRPDIALLTGADGLHLGQEDLPLAQARQLVGPRMPIGLSTHSLAQALAAEAEGADYIGFGPIFTTPSKVRPDPVVGTAGLCEVLKQVSLPVVAIGGLDETNLAQVAAGRVPAVAVIRALLAAEKPAARVIQLRALCRY